MKSMHILQSVLGLSILLGLSATTRAADHCHSTETFQRSFSVVTPSARQILLTGDRAKQYLAEYNRFPPPSNVIADDVLLIVSPNGTTIMIPIGADTGCKRILISPRLHRIIMLRIGRDQI